MTSAITHQLDAHSQQIALLLATMPDGDSSSIEDAAYKELQTIPSTSLISRSMVRGACTGRGTALLFQSSIIGQRQ